MDFSDFVDVILLISMGATSAPMTFFVAPDDFSPSTYDLFLAPMISRRAPMIFCLLPLIFRRAPMIFSLLPSILRPPPHFFSLNTRGFSRTCSRRRKKTPRARQKARSRVLPYIEAHEGRAIEAPPGTVLRQQPERKENAHEKQWNSGARRAGQETARGRPEGSREPVVYDQ